VPTAGIVPKFWNLEMGIDALHLNAHAAIALVCSSILAACGANPANPTSDSELTGAIFSVSCEFGWADCYSEAQRRCTNGEFEELDRNAIERVTVDSRSARSTPVRVESMNRAMTIRCK
jgi:hypothetical protein